MLDQINNLPTQPVGIRVNRKRLTLILLVFVVFFLLVGGGVYAAYIKHLWVFSSTQETGETNSNGTVVANSSVTQSAEALQAKDVLALLGKVQQAHFAVKYTGTDQLGSAQESEGDITVSGNYQFTTGIVKLPKEHITNDPRDTTEGGLGLMTMGNNVVRVGDHEYHRIDMQALVEANVVPAEILAGPDAATLSGWEEGTQNKIQFFPNELYYLQNFSQLASTLTKNSDGSWQGIVAEDVEKAMIWQTQRWRGDNTQWRYISEDEKLADLKDYTPEDPKTFPTFSVYFSPGGELDRVVFTNLASQGTTTTFSRFSVIPKIQLPDLPSDTSADAQFAYAQHYNIIRAEAAKLIASSIVEVYKGTTFPVTQSIRLDDATNAISKRILNDLASATTAHTPYTTRALEDAFWVKKTTDPVPQKYYYGYASSDGKGFTLTFVQQRDDTDIAMECNTKEADCIKVLRYPEN